MATKKLTKAQQAKVAEQTPKVTYDPNKQWGWKSDSIFELTGMEFHKLNTALSDFIVSDMNVPTILKLAEAFGIIQNKLSEYVDKGVITEVLPEGQE